MEQFGTELTEESVSTTVKRSNSACTPINRAIKRSDWRKRFFCISRQTIFMGGIGYRPLSY